MTLGDDFRSQGQAQGARSGKSRVHQGPHKVQPCNQPQCMLCPTGPRPGNMTSTSTFRSTVTRRMFTIRLHDSKPITCRSTDCVYLITCSKCGIQYVGKTGGKEAAQSTGNQTGNAAQSTGNQAKNPIRGLNKRFSDHRARLRKYVRDADLVTSHSHLLYKHFDGHSALGCTLEDIVFQPIEHMPGKETAVLEEREQHWIHTLRTLSPYGLNSRLDNVEKADHVEDRFSKLEVRRGTRGRRPRSSFSAEDYLAEIVKEARTSERWLFHTRVRVNALTRSKQWRLLTELHRFTGEANQTDKQVLQVLLDLLNRRLSIGTGLRPEKERPKLIWKVPFVNPGLNRLGLERMLHSEKLQEVLPEDMEIKKPTVVYTYTEPTRKTLLNYSKVVRNIRDADWEQSRQPAWHRKSGGRLERKEPHPQPPLGPQPQHPPVCECHEFAGYINQDHGHVMTGDLRLVSNLRLRRLLSFGPSYREPKPINWNEVYDAVMGNSLQVMLDEWKKKERRMTEEKVGDWATQMVGLVVEKMEKLEKEWDTKDLRVLSSAAVKRDLEYLQRRFVFVPADKSANNIVLVCKRFYVQRLVKELTDESTKTYVPHTEETEEKAIERIAKDVDEKWKVKVRDEWKKLPFMYWTAKMHKTPPAPRFIAASHACVTKPLSRLLCKILRVVQKEAQARCEQLRNHDGIKRFLIIENNDEVVRTVEDMT